MKLLQNEVPAIGQGSGFASQYYHETLSECDRWRKGSAQFLLFPLCQHVFELADWPQQVRADV
jgi:hypothetical protein